MMDKQTAKLVIADQTIDLPVRDGTVGPQVIDISQLANHRLFTYDPGFTATAACESRLTYIDGDKGQLLHRGYNIDELAENSSHLEVAWLLLNGELPNQQEIEKFEKDIKYHTLIHEHMVNFFRGFHADAHPMAMLCSAVGALAAFYHDQMDISNEQNRYNAAIRLIAKLPTLAAMSYKHSIGQPFMYPDNSLNYTDNFLHMMFGTPCEPSEINPVLAKALDRVFLLHIDHEQNASTSTVRLTGSSGANPFACIAAGIAALWGPAHGGANEAVLRMLQEIGDEKNIGKFIERAKDKNDPFRLMGFGHRVYKNYDPRAKVMRLTCNEVLDTLGLGDEPMLKMARKLEKIALEDDYFIAKKLYPNVDFYSGIILKALGIPSTMFTVIFAIGRTPGWVAHWHEMLGSNFRIGRPRQLYLGPLQRPYVPLSERD